MLPYSFSRFQEGKWYSYTYITGTCTQKHFYGYKDVHIFKHALHEHFILREGKGRVERGGGGGGGGLFMYAHDITLSFAT